MSGEITITPGKQMAPGETISNVKLNQGFRPVAQVNAGAITTREIAADSVRAGLGLAGRNLFCNGNFAIYSYVNEPLTAAGSSGSQTHAVSPDRWLAPSIATRSIGRQNFIIGQTDVPGNPVRFVRWIQSAPMSVNPGYFGQRLEDVRRLSGQTLTMSFWVRADGPITITPQARQWFGTPHPATYSDPVLVGGTPALLSTGIWQQVTQTFILPSVTGKTISTGLSFAEFRVVLPQGVAFTVDFANVQLELGSSATAFEQRAPHEEFAFAARYLEMLGIELSDNLATHGTPSVNVTVPKFRSPDLTLYPTSGTGATLGYNTNLGMRGLIIQIANHSAIAPGAILVNSEINDDDYLP